MKYYDCHVHTKNSHDSQQEAGELVNGLIAAGVSGVSVTDHLDTMPGSDESFADNIGGSFEFYRDELKPLAEGNGLDAFFGVELGDGIRNPGFALDFPSRYPFDVILGSVHKIYLDGGNFTLYPQPYESFSAEKRRRIVATYYDDVLLTASTLDIDVLSHLTLINRYNGYPLTSDIFDSEFKDRINDILDTIIRRGIALEVNSKGFEGGRLMPDRYVIEEYFRKGGRLITLGSDAHRGVDIGRGFKETARMLREIGFKSIDYFKGREPVEYPIDAE